MISNFFESDLILIEPSAFTQVERLPKPGTSGVVFRATERPTGRMVAVKISHAEESSKGCLLAEASALQSPLRSVAEPGSEPTVREFYRRHDPFARVGLIMEWLDDSYTPVEKLIQDPELKLTELQILRIIAPFTALLAVAHKLGYIYVDIGADKADHLWWRVQRRSNGRWRVPSGADGRPRFQLKVIDWANAINMADPAYAGNVTPADDIVGVGALLFYMSRGPLVPLPTSADSSVLQPQKGSLDDIIRKAMFIEVEGSFVKEAQRSLTTSERRELLRNPEMRSAATTELNDTIRADLAKLSNRYLTLVTRARDSIQAIDEASARGLLALNKQIPEELVSLSGSERLQSVSDINAQALDVIETLREMISRARQIDPDGPETDLLDSDLERLERVIAERRGLENIRRLLTQIELVPHVDLKRIFDSIARMRKAQGELVFGNDLRLLEQLAYAISEAGQLPNGLDAVQDTAVLPLLMEQALDSHCVLTPTGAQEARKTILSLSHWGNGSNMHALRITISQRAHAPILRDQVTSIVQSVRKTKQGIDSDINNPNISASTRKSSAVSSAVLGRLTSSLEESLNALKAIDIDPSIATILDVQAIYSTLARTLQDLSGTENVEIFDKDEQADDLQILQQTIRSVESALIETTASLNEGNLKQAFLSLQQFAELDPQSVSAQRYIKLLYENSELDRNEVATAINNAESGILADLLQALQSKAAFMRQLVPQSDYLFALQALGNLGIPLSQELARYAPSVRPLFSQTLPQDGHARFSSDISKALREALIISLQTSFAPSLATQQSNSKISSLKAMSEKLLEAYKEINRWQQPWSSGYRPSPADMQHRIPILVQRLASVDQEVPTFNSVTKMLRSYTFTACLDQAVETLENGAFSAADDWLHVMPVTAPTQEQVNTVTVSQMLIGAVRAWEKTGPVQALDNLVAPSATRALQTSGGYRTGIETVFGRLKKAFEQENELLAWTHMELAKVNGAKDPGTAALHIERTLEKLIKQVNILNTDQYQSATPLQQDLQALFQIWTTSLTQARKVNSMSQDWALELGQPLQAAKLLNLVRSLEQAGSAIHIGRGSGQVRPETLDAVFKPLADALRKIAQLIEISTSALRATNAGSADYSASASKNPVAAPDTRFSIYFGKIAFGSEGSIFDRLSSLSFLGFAIGTVGAFFLALVSVFGLFSPNDPTWVGIKSLITSLFWWAISIGMVVLLLGLIPRDARVRYQGYSVPLLVLVLFLGLIGVGSTLAYRALFTERTYDIDPAFASSEDLSQTFTEISSDHKSFAEMTFTATFGLPISPPLLEYHLASDTDEHNYEVQYFNSIALTLDPEDISGQVHIMLLGRKAFDKLPKPTPEPPLLSKGGPNKASNDVGGHLLLDKLRLSHQYMDVTDRSSIFTPTPTSSLLYGVFVEEWNNPQSSKLNSTLGEYVGATLDGDKTSAEYFDHAALQLEGNEIKLLPLGHDRYYNSDYGKSRKPISTPESATPSESSPTSAIADTPIAIVATATLAPSPTATTTATPSPIVSVGEGVTTNVAEATTISATSTPLQPSDTPKGLPASPTQLNSPTPYTAQVNSLLVFQPIRLSPDNINKITLAFTTTGKLDTAGFSFWRMLGSKGQFFVEQLSFDKDNTGKLEVYNTKAGEMDLESNKAAIIHQLRGKELEMLQQEVPGQVVPDLRSDIITLTLTLTSSLTAYPGGYATLLTALGSVSPASQYDFSNPVFSSPPYKNTLSPDYLAIHFSAQDKDTMVEILSLDVNGTSQIDGLKLDDYQEKKP